MTNPVPISTANPAPAGRAYGWHTVGVEPVTDELHRHTYITGTPVWAAVERYEGRLVEVCGTGEDPADMVTLARAAASTYGATYIPVHPSTLAALGAPGALAENAQCVYDPALHLGPACSESPSEKAAREDVAREVCATCPARQVCGIYALKACPASGVWAGMTAAEIDAQATRTDWLEAA
ncbi:WhiB family transcriptional regulator [Sphaerisporangium sp. NBC_01403]|uniref:WhiB family transcriptional regulator n=1 Tax=Sphaerisporangium sp. NBC_01403 TaxID=2903599 RepID=UPI00324BD5F3